MNKKQMSEKGLSIVAYAGDARSCFLQALKSAQKNDFKKADEQIKEGRVALLEAHRQQTDLLQAEAAGKYSDVTLIMVHGQDHLMTAELLADMLDSIIELYRNRNENK